MPAETDARIVVDRLLREAGWDIEDKSQVSTDEPTSDGRADYLLKNAQTRPLAVIETKKFSIDPYSAKEQAKGYAESLGAPFIILSNGQEHYLWDYADSDARAVLGLPSRADLERRANLKVHRRGSLEESLRAIPPPRPLCLQGRRI
jgi:type I site-specific restriction endonuclease